MSLELEAGHLLNLCGGIWAFCLERPFVYDVFLVLNGSAGYGLDASWRSVDRQYPGDSFLSKIIFFSFARHFCHIDQCILCNEIPCDSCQPCFA